MARDDRLPKQLPLLPADYMLSDDSADPRLGMSDEEIDAHWESVMWVFSRCARAAYVSFRQESESSG